jgi:hypothetical protein
MTTIQTQTAGRVRYRLKRGRRELLLISDKPIDPPSIFAGCPAPAPGGGVVELLPGYGPVAVIPEAADPAQAGLAAAGFTINDGPYPLAWSPSACGAGADLVVPLLPGPVEWSSDLAGLMIEAGFDYVSVPLASEQSHWIGLADPSGDNVIAVGLRGSRETGAGYNYGVWLRVGGVTRYRGVMAEPVDPTASGQYKLRLSLDPVGGGASGRRAIQFAQNVGAGWQHEDNSFNSMDPVDPADWAALVALLVSGDLGPAWIVTHRDAPGARDRLIWTSLRIA